MNTERKWGSHQAFVDDTVYWCISSGIRTRAEIIAHIQLERVDQNNQATWEGDGFRSGVEDLDRTDKALAHRISLTTSRKDANGHRDIWCVPGKYRFVSIQRIKDLVGVADAGTISAQESAELIESIKDIEDLYIHQLAKLNDCRAAMNQLEAVQIHATVAVLDLRDAVREAV